jgi:hypothetical protein
MTVPAPTVGVPAHRRLTFSGVFGTLAAPYERWSFRLNLGTDIEGDDPAVLLDAAALGFQQDIASEMKPHVRLTEIKYARIAAGGLYSGAPVLKEVNTPGGATFGPIYPPQVALAVSLVTDRRGPTGRGRIYLPAPPHDVQAADGRTAAALAQQTATLFAGFINRLNGPAGFGDVSIVSTKGYSTKVTGVRVGRVLDTIRSRRTDLPEDYGATVVVT